MHQNENIKNDFVFVKTQGIYVTSFENFQTLRIDN